MKPSDFMESLSIGEQDYSIYNILLLERDGKIDIRRLPFSIRILVENLLRKQDGKIVKEPDLLAVANWKPHQAFPVEIPHHPARVLMQDFTGVPAVVDLAAIRDAVQKAGNDPACVNPLIPVDLIVDHSVQLDCYGTRHALKENVALEYKRNNERYQLLKWAQASFDNFKVVPPGAGICHQVNLEYLSQVIIDRDHEGRHLLYPDSLVGTDSHTTMINGIGVIGWGVGGIEAEAVMLGQPYFMAIPEVIGVKLVHQLKPGVTATDLVLTLTRLLRNYHVVDKFIEFFGPGLKYLSVPDRATIANMSPEYGATMGFFPVDEQTLEYLELTNRNQQARITEIYTKACGLFYTGDEKPEYTDIIEFDLSKVAPGLAGPSRPQDHILINETGKHFHALLGCRHDRDDSVKHISRFLDESGCIASREARCEPSEKRQVQVDVNGEQTLIGDGSIVIAAITSCTNTSNPFGLIGAGLLARNAVKNGLHVKASVKTSFAPGSKVVEAYLVQAGLMPYLEALGFHVAGFGCTTCIGNSGPLHPEIETAIREHDLTVVSVLSGNRNFEARIHQHVKGNFLASPMLVIAYAIAGRIDVDLTTEPLARDPNGKPVYLKDLWPKNTDIETLVKQNVTPDQYRTEYAKIFSGDIFWKELSINKSVIFKWNEDSTYIKHPPYFENFSLNPKPLADIADARALLLLGDSVTTDHISPAGAISGEYPAGRYLLKKLVRKENFNSYGSRRGNHEVMARGTFGNIRIKNRMVSPKEGSFTRKFPENETGFIYDIAMAYQKEGIPLIVIGGKEYGTGSSRDWAAKGSQLLGIRAVIAESYERIHRSNLVGMGVLPLAFMPKENASVLGLDGSEQYTIKGLKELIPQGQLNIQALKSDGSVISFNAVARLNTDIEVRYFKHGGILPFVLRKLIRTG